jgi:hypothetical protein
VHHLTGAPGGVQVSRAKQREKAADKPVDRYSAFTFPRAFPRLLDDLIALEMIRQDLGIQSGNPSLARRTVIFPAKQLVELTDRLGVTRADFSTGGEADQLIILSRKKKGWGNKQTRVQYKDDDTTRAYHSQIKALNDWLAGADVQYEGQPRAAGTLRRNFSNGRFDHGGRLNGGFWQNISKEERRRSLQVAGESVIGVDYAAMYPALLYWVADVQQADDDAYRVSGFEQYRPAVKTVFNAMLFARVTQFPKGVREAHGIPRRVKITELTEAILAKHPSIASYLTGSDIGHVLQFHESALLLRVLEACKRRGIVALPVHDCIYVAKSHAAEAQQIMVAEFKEMTGGRAISARIEG